MDRQDVASWATVRELLATEELQESTLLGGAAGLDMFVEQVQLVTESLATVDACPGALLVIDSSRKPPNSYAIDIVLRAASDAGSSGVVIARPAEPIAVAPRRLADRLALPLLDSSQDVLTLVDRLRELVSRPERALASTMMRSVAALHRAAGKGELSEVLRVLDEALFGRSAIVGHEGRAMLGAEIESHDGLLKHNTSFTMTEVGEGRARASFPLVPVAGELPALWIVVEKQNPIGGWARLAEELIRVASQYVIVSILTERIDKERDARFALGTLNTILSTDQVNPALMRQLSILGWRVDGWCTAVHLAVSGGTGDSGAWSRSSSLREALRGAGVSGPVIEQPEAWTSWAVTEREPTPESYRALTTSLRSSLWGIVDAEGAVRVAVGIGRPYRGILGLRRSISEAHEAVTIAQAGGARLSVQHIDELGVERVLYNWYSSPALTSFSRTLLAPLAGLEDGELVRTLEVYLDNESSATTAGDVLGVHRNTIINRLARIRNVIAVDLDDADQRLALQLACRVVNLVTE